MLLPTEALAKQISVSPRTLERWRIEGSGPSFLKAGRRVLYSMIDVETWLNSSRRNSTSESVPSVSRAPPIFHDVNNIDEPRFGSISIPNLRYEGEQE